MITGASIGATLFPAFRFSLGLMLIYLGLSSSSRSRMLFVVRRAMTLGAVRFGS